MMPKHTVKLLAIVSVFLGMPLIATAAPSKGDPAAGQKIFAGTCEVCHGPTGRGEDSSMAGYLLTERMPDLSSGKTQGKTDVELRSILLTGHGPDMMSYKGVFDDSQLDDLIAYIRSLKR